LGSVLLDTVAAAAAAAPTAVTGAVITVTHGFFWLDPVLAAVIAVLIGGAAVTLMRDGVRELRVPATA
jgi:divalent metal cation (Fe/Co/Zn/Cd) transporter